MKILIFLLAFLTTFTSFGQSKVSRATPATTVEDANLFVSRSFRLPIYNDTTQANSQYPTLDSAGKEIYTRVDSSVWVRTVNHRWIKASGSVIIPGGPITTIPIVGTNPGTNLDPSQWVINTFYGAQPPTATLTGGGIFEFTSASTFPTTLNWSASRQSATATLATIVVAGVTKSFSQPSAPGTVSGTQAVTPSTNTTTTYNNVVTASDGLSATASTSFIYRSKYYIGYITTSTPTDADILAATGGTVGGVFATTQVTSLTTLPDPPGARYIVFAYPASFGTATIKINGLAVAYNLTTRPLINASGYSTSYNIYVSPFSTSGGVDYQIL